MTYLPKTELLDALETLLSRCTDYVDDAREDDIEVERIDTIGDDVQAAVAVLNAGGELGDDQLDVLEEYANEFYLTLLAEQPESLACN